MFDATCQAVLQARPGATDVYSQRLGELQKLYAQELPVIPLYFRMKIAASRPDFCGLEMDVSARTALWNIEAFDYGSGCK
jgi:peptide/nickel transport system substrate-binding protein